MTTAGPGDGTQVQSAPPTQPYALRFSVDYPDRDLDRLSSALRIFWVIPIVIVLAALGGVTSSWSGWATAGGIGTGVLMFAPMLMIVFRRKYPRWWFDFNVELMRFQARVEMYMMLTTDAYPSTDEQQSVHLEADYPDVERDLGQWHPLFKWILAIPHYIVLAFLAIAAIFVLIYVWFVILFGGRYPRGAFDFIIGVSRWGHRVTAYAFLLNTDVYPPFSLD